jgi:hypothetical protein
MNPNVPNQTQPYAQTPVPTPVTPPQPIVAQPAAYPTQQLPQPPQPIYAAPQPNPVQLPPPPVYQPPQQAPLLTYAPAPTAYAPPIEAPAPQVVTATTSPALPAKPVAPRTNPNSTQNTLQIAEIRDGIVIMGDGSYRSVVMVKSINFDLMSGQEQEAVEYSYQGFLNSLYFPVQIFIRSQKVDLEPYIEKLDKIRSEHDNMLLALLMEDYIDYIDTLSRQTNIMDKRFYIVIPYFPLVEVQKAITQSKNFFSGILGLFNTHDQHVTINEAELEAAKTELRNRVQSVLSGLLQCGIQGLPLDTQELIELYYDTYNPDTATRQQLKNFDQMTADVIMKGQGTAPQPHLQRELQ